MYSYHSSLLNGYNYYTKNFLFQEGYFPNDTEITISIAPLNQGSFEEFYTATIDEFFTDSARDLYIRGYSDGSEVRAYISETYNERGPDRRCTSHPGDPSSAPALHGNFVALFSTFVALNVMMFTLF